MIKKKRVDREGRVQNRVRAVFRKDICQFFLVAVFLFFDTHVL